MDENALENIVLPALTKHKSIPQAYMGKPTLMQTAIHYLTGYDFRQRHPYQISCASNGCEEDGLEPYVEDVLDTFLQAITTRKVKNLPQYMKSLLWTSFATYKLNTISGITAPYKEVKNVYGLH